MKYHTPIAQEIATILDRLRSAVSSAGFLSNVKAPALAVVDKMTTSFADMQATAQQAGASMLNVRAEGDLNLAAKAQRQATIAGQTRSTITADLDALDAGVAELGRTLGKIASPARPAGNEAAQEARLANVRADVAMVLDRTPTHALPQACAELITTWAEAGDTLSVWFLASSGWLTLYLQSRNAGDARPLVEQAMAAAIAPTNSSDAALARTVLAQLSGPSGLAGAVTRMRYVMTEMLNEIGVDL